MAVTVPYLITLAVQRKLHSQYMHACMHACMHAYIHTYIQTDRHTYIHPDIDVNMCTIMDKALATLSSTLPGNYCAGSRVAEEVHRGTRAFDQLPVHGSGGRVVAVRCF